MTDAAVSRRRALASGGALALAWALDPRAFAQDRKTWEPLNRHPRMVHDYLVGRLRAIEAASTARKDALRTKADAEAWVLDVRERIRTSFGPLPERSPLHPQVTKTVERDAYRIENTIFESRPGFRVTANVYVPKGEGRRPAVVGTCGHSANGKAAEAYQSFAQGLARLGFVVLIYDPIGQGERLQYVDDALKSRVGVGVGEHLLAGNQQFLVDEFLGTWRAWDGIRALDLLLERTDVDPARVMVTGNSGGGTMTTWLTGLEQRWAAAAPSCFVTTFLRNLENELSADTEQCPPRALALKLDHDDFLSALAPKPVLAMAQERDYFDARGTEEANRRMKRLYGLLGSEENAGLHIGPDTHGFTKANREAMYRWFARAAGLPPVEAEPALVIEKDETLWCTPKGQVAPLGSRTVMSFTKEKAERLAAARPKLSGAALAEAAAEVLRLPPPASAPPAYRIQRGGPGRGYPRKQWLGYWVETEPGILASVYRLDDERQFGRPIRGFPETALYVSHHSADQELRDEPLARDAAGLKPGAPFYAVDLRGIGDSRPGTGGPGDTFLAAYGNDYHHAIHGVMLDEPTVGRRTHDLLRVLDFLGAAGHEKVSLFARGWGAIPAAFAALLSARVVSVTLKNALTSYDAIARAEIYKWPLSSLLPGVLKRFDLPDVYAALEAKGLKMIDPRGPEGA